ncbi:hypothetical protein D9615_005501 [Tricholomella constricta]|uniref:Endopeptidase S2P n=1 Tax=Tricholomella constricta TaxID=117010 RepID=A0A8H5HE28_9AGAR|nr:hypothetical protein D9615_005501 [Tricholomella constricta]
MSLASPLLVLTLIWAAIYAIYHLLKPSKAQSLLPFTTNARHGRRNVWKESATQVTLKGLHLRIQTTIWNLRHDLLAMSLQSPSNAPLSQALKFFYDLGFVMGLIGMLCALGFLSITGGISTVSLTRKVWAATNSPIHPVSSEGFGSLLKRSLDAFDGREILTSDESWVKPIIPGVTVPLADLPIILLAVFLAQIVHELGHAIAAAIESVPILSAGLSFTFVIPSAFVSFSPAALDSLAPRARARIIAAGPFHNILLWCVLVSFGYTRLGDVFWSVGYQDLSTLGRIVVGVESKSPLHGYLPSGTLITALDDTVLGSQNVSYDAWTSYLNQGSTDQNLGWCAGPLDGGNTCCLTKKTPGLSCFVSTDTPSTRGCLNPVPVLTSASKVERCNFTADCPGLSICVRPDETEKLLRLTVVRPFVDAKSEVILWSGPREEVWEEVRVGTLLPRTSFLPVSLPYSGEIFWQYLLMATLSLYFFNLLPLPHLDGLQFLNAMLQMALGDRGDETVDVYDLEALVEPSQGRRRSRWAWWKRTLGRLIPRFTIGLLVVYTLLGVTNVYW